MARFIVSISTCRHLLITAAVLLFALHSAVGAIGPGSTTGRVTAESNTSDKSLAPSQPLAANSNPGIAPPSSNSHGKSYGEWAAAWWQKELSIPADRNPLTDTTGQFCGEGQSGPVWFLEGGFGTTVTRSCSIPTGKAIFMPVYNWLFGAAAFDCEPSNPGVPCDVPTLYGYAAIDALAWMKPGGFLKVWIDGTPVQNLEEYRAWSPVPFSLTLPSNNVLGLPSGTYYPQVTDGYWLMLNPLPKGVHIIHTSVVAPTPTSYPGNGLIAFDAVYNLIIQ